MREPDLNTLERVKAGIINPALVRKAMHFRGFMRVMDEFDQQMVDADDESRTPTRIRLSPRGEILLIKLRTKQ
jgi:hypothetical protein